MMKTTSPALGAAHDTDDAQALVRQAFRKAYQRLDQFRETARCLSGIVRIAVNNSLAKVDGRRANRQFLAEDRQQEIDWTPLSMARWLPQEQKRPVAELRQILRQNLETIAPALRSVLVLRDVEMLSTNETAKVLNLTPIAVKGRLFRARLQLRAKLSRDSAKPNARPESVNA